MIVSSAAGYGIDLSSNQRVILANELRAAGVQFAYVKATEGGSYANPTMDAQLVQLALADVPAGVYHFARPGGKYAPAEQAAWAWGRSPLSARTLVPMLDVETLDGRPAADVSAWVGEFLDAAYRLSGVPWGVYGSPAFLGALGLPERIGRLHPLWVAHYTVGRPSIPAPWTSAALWQYTDSGRVAGVRVDASRLLAPELPMLRAAARAEVRAMRDHGSPWQLVKRARSFLTFTRTGGH